MKIPDKVRIGSIDYTVEITGEVIIVDRKECNGEIDYNEKVIKIRNDMQCVQSQEITLLHEIVHGIVYERNFAYEKCNEETITEELARGLHQVIKDNPEMFGGVSNG